MTWCSCSTIQWDAHWLCTCTHLLDMLRASRGSSVLVQSASTPALVFMCSVCMNASCHLPSWSSSVLQFDFRPIGSASMHDVMFAHKPQFRCHVVLGGEGAESAAAQSGNGLQLIVFAEQLPAAASDTCNSCVGLGRCSWQSVLACMWLLLTRAPALATEVTCSPCGRFWVLHSAVCVGMHADSVDTSASARSRGHLQPSGGLGALLPGGWQPSAWNTLQL
jgi:hypothetical protein